MPDTSDDAFALLEANAPTGLVARDTEVVLAGGPVQHAVDSRGRRHLLVPLSEGQVGTEDRGSRGVTIRPHELVDRNEVHRYLDITCEIPSLRDLFAVVCDEMLERMGSTPSTPGAACLAVLERWRELIGGASDPLLSRQALSGILAELHLLERLAALDPRSALTVWTGPTKGRVDFTGAEVAVEVKATTARERLTVEIHGATQLEPPSGVELFLRVERQEQVPTEGDAVPDAVRRLLELGMNPGALMRALQAAGYAAEDATAYSQVRFRTLDDRYYRVVADFPRIDRTSFHRPEILERVTQLRYVLDLTVQPPLPLTPVEVGVLLGRLVAVGASA